MTTQHTFDAWFDSAKKENPRLGKVGKNCAYLIWSAAQQEVAVEPVAVRFVKEVPVEQPQSSIWQSLKNYFRGFAKSAGRQTFSTGPR